MIDIALTFLKDQVNDYIKTVTGSSDDKVKLTNIPGGSDGYGFEHDKVGMTLVNLEEERVIKDQNYTRRSPDGTISKVNPEIRLNLYLLFAANPLADNYTTGLKLLSHVVTYFQGNSVFDTTNSPGLDPQVKKLILDMYTMPLEQQHYLWSAIGAKYLPSVIYKVRLVAVQMNNSSESSPAIFQIQSNLQQS